MDILHYYSRYQSTKSSFSSLASWARFLIVLLALPGIVLILLSLLALGVSILALLLLTVPAYRFLRFVTGAGRSVSPGEAVSEVISTEGEQVTVEPASPDPASPGRRHIDVKIIE